MFNFISIPPCSHFVSIENDVFRGYKTKTFEKNELKPKYNNKFIWTRLDLLTFKIILSL